MKKLTAEELKKAIEESFRTGEPFSFESDLEPEEVNEVASQVAQENPSLVGGVRRPYIATARRDKT